MAARGERGAGDPHEGAARAEDSATREGAGLRTSVAGVDPEIYRDDSGCRSSLVPSRGGAWWIAPAPGPRLAQRHPRRATGAAGCADAGALDDGGHLRPRIRH